jgi:hypothetical protein
MGPEPNSGRFRYRLVTLLDLMKPFHAAIILNFLDLLHRFRLHEQTFIISGRLTKLEQSAQADGYRGGVGDPQDSDSLDDEFRRTALPAFTGMESNCIDLELGTSLATVRKIITVISRAGSQYGNLYPLVEELSGRLIDEIESKSFFALTTREREYYEQPRKGWDEVIIRFPESVIDIEEASKCFALSRYAAAVFHSLQVVEIGLIDLGRVIVATDPQIGWNATTKRLNKILSTKYQDRTPFQKHHSHFLEQINATIEALKSAWRNKISHAHDKLVLLTSDFTPEVAEEILIASRSFMRRLATDAPASPDPDA